MEIKLFSHTPETIFEKSFWKNFTDEKTLQNILSHFVKNYPYTDQEYKTSFAVDIIGKTLIQKKLDERKLMDLLEQELSKLDHNTIITKPGIKHTTEKQENMTIYYADKLGGNEFQDFISELLKVNGFSDVRVTGRSGDQGGDLLATQDNEQIVIQAKRYSIDRKVTNNAVQEALGAIGYYNANKGIVVTNSFFTSSAKELAKKNDIVLWDRRDVSKFIDKYNEITNKV